jgi:hypothetical protein
MKKLTFLKKKVHDSEHIEVIFIDQHGDEVKKEFFYWDTDSSYPLGEQMVYREVNGEYYFNLIGDIYGRPNDTAVVNLREIE